MDFLARSRETAAEFIRSVVLVDDRAVYKEPDAVSIEDLETPDELSGTSAEEKTLIDPEGRGGELDAGMISKAFASQGMICAILRPTETASSDGMDESILKAAGRSDVLILDWQMNDQGEFATSIIRRLQDQDERKGGRLRLLVVYTNAGSETVIDALRAEFAAVFEPGETLPDASQGHPTAKVGNAYLVVISKEGTANESMTVTEHDLPGHIHLVFGALVGGLLPNAMMSSISALRDDTHNILGRFDKGADAAYLTHRAMIPRPQDSEEFAVDLLIGEIESHLEIRNAVAQQLGPEAVQAYLGSRISGGLQPALRWTTNNNDGTTEEKIINLAEEDVRSLAIDGLKSFLDKASGDADLKTAAKKLKSDTAAMLPRVFSEGDAQGEMEQFAIRAKLAFDTKSRPHARPPRLQLGTILCAGPIYWLCVTPACDAVRLDSENEHWFSFVELREADRFDVIVPSGSDNLRLQVARNRARTLSARFRPSGERFVEMKLDAGEWVVDARSIGASEGPSSNPADSSAVGEAIRFRWLGEIKSAHAQRLVQTYANTVSRIGLDEFDWHRTQMPKG